MANIEEIKKMADEQGVELTDDVLEAIAGGVIPYEEWTKMTKEQRRAAQTESENNRDANLPCILD